MLDTIYKAAEQAAPEEMCGLIIEKDGNEEFINCENFAENKLNEFKIDPKTFVKYQLISKIKYVVHSHYDSKCNPSNQDKKSCRAMGVPYMIVSYPEKEMCIYDPS